MKTQVAVVIVSYNSAEVIEGLLASIPAAMGDLDASVVVVDNGSSDNSVEVVEAFGGCKVVRGQNVGYAAGINAGVAALPEAQTILILNPDVRLHPGSVERMFSTLMSSGAGVVAPRVLNSDGSLFRSLRREPTLLRATGLGFTKQALLDEYISDPEAYEHRQVVEWALGAALLVRTEVHDQLSGWDASYFLYSEETDFSLRAADHGWPTIYEPAAVATHIGGASGQSERTQTMQIINRVRLYARRHRAFPAACYFALVVLSEASRIARGNRESRTVLRALLMPSRRPQQLNCSGSFIPR